MTLDNRAIALIEDARGALASAIARQIKRTVPRYKTEDFTAIHLNIRALLEGLPALIRGEALDDLTDTVRTIAKERAGEGFRLADLTIAALCVLPVLRHFFLREGGDDGLAMYDLVEAVTLPFVGRAIAIFAETPTGASPEGVILEELLSRLSDPDSRTIAPVSIEGVDG